MRALLTTTMALGIVLTLGANQPLNAIVTSPTASGHQQSQIILARGGHGGHGHEGHWHGGGGHHEYWGGGEGYYGGPGYYYGPGYDYYNYGPGPGGVCVGPLCVGF